MIFSFLKICRAYAFRVFFAFLCTGVQSYTNAFFCYRFLLFHLFSHYYFISLSTSSRILSFFSLGYLSVSASKILTNVGHQNLAGLDLFRFGH